MTYQVLASIPVGKFEKPKALLLKLGAGEHCGEAG